MSLRKPKKLIFDRNVDFTQAKIIQDRQAEQKHLNKCKAEVDKVLNRYNAEQLPHVSIIGPQIKTGILYVTISPAPEKKDIN